MMSAGPSSPQCRTPLPRPTPYRRPATPTCEPGERLPPSPTDPQLSVDLRKTALLRSLLLRTEVSIAFLVSSLSVSTPHTMHNGAFLLSTQP